MLTLTGSVIYSQSRCIKKERYVSSLFYGAEDGIRTRNVQLGKLTLYR